MQLGLSDEQRLLKEMLERFLDATGPGQASHAPEAVSRWQRFADELGILGVAFPSDSGGLGGGAVDVMIVMEALGRGLAAEPFLETVVLGGALLRDGGPGTADMLQQIASGKTQVALGHFEEHVRFQRWNIDTRAVRHGSGWKLDGSKCLVAASPATDWLVVSARIDAGEQAGLFLVPLTATGISLREYALVDGQPAADLIFAAVELPDHALLCSGEEAWHRLECALDEAIAAQCAEAVGIMRYMLAATVDYTKQRKQFGQALAQFQVLQHRMVDMYIATERAAAATLLATLKVGSAVPERQKATSAAKVATCEALRFVSQNAVQLHGAMGLTDELRLSAYFRRAVVIANQFGTASHHIGRYSAVARARPFSGQEV